VTDPAADLRRDYRPPFLSYLTHLDERGLSAAYELGRQTMLRRLGLLELVRVHNEVYLEVMSDARTPAEAQSLARAASAFLLEALAPFDDPTGLHGRRRSREHPSRERRRALRSHRTAWHLAGTQRTTVTAHFA
jgi:hypothetical protein